MAAYQHLLDSALLCNTSIKLSSLLEGGDMDTRFSTYPSQPLQETPCEVKTHQSNCLYNDYAMFTDPTATERTKSGLSSMVVELDSDDHMVDSTEKKKKKKRKTKDGSYLSSAQSQDMRGMKTKKQRKCSSKKEETEEKKSKSLKKDQKKVITEPPTGYIHVRARRGQATDSHSLAERVRREKISERMKLLQSLVPGCDKVTGKAVMLDEIINYVQSLQYQVEFLSMKLTSVNPVLHDFGADINAFMVKPEKMSSLGSPLQATHPSNLSQPTIMGDITAAAAAAAAAGMPTKNNYSIQNNAVSFLPLQQQDHQMLTAFSQDNEYPLWDVYDHQRQRILNQCGFNSLSSFQ